MAEVGREVAGYVAQEGGGAAAVERFRLRSGSLAAEILSLGCTLRALHARGRDGRPADVVLGFERPEGYVNKHPYFGAVIGRVANRIAKGKFTVEGKEYQLALNSPPNSLHGGNKGFDKFLSAPHSPGGRDAFIVLVRDSGGLISAQLGKVSLDQLDKLKKKKAKRVLWTPEVVANGVRFFRRSPDGEEGYPGELKVWVTYTLDGGELAISYRAQSSKTTPISLTNHAYFNLAGQGSPDIYDHEVSIEADSYLPVDDNLIPTGEVAAVEGTAFDLRKPVELGRHLQKFQLPGFDHTFCLGEAKARRYCARVHHPPSGRTMEIYTTQPGIQFYTGNFLDGSLKGKGGFAYPKHSAFCLETQHWPDAVNKPHFPSMLLQPGEEYSHTTWIKFTAA